MSTPSPSEDLRRIIESADRLGIELDEAEAMQWLGAMAAGQGEEIVMDERAGVFGYRVTMLDFSPADLEHFRRIGRLVEFKDVPGVVETALALSGSSAQSKIQTYPGDADYFERVNILAESREAACRILAGLIRQKALETRRGPNYQLTEVKFGSYAQDLVKGGKKVSKGSPINWTPEEIAAGKIEAFSPDGQPVTVLWDEVAAEPGWTKLDWVIADPPRGKLANASNMLDITWEAPDGGIIPLDGYLDPYFQEVYLEAGSVPIFSKLAQHVSANALDDYVTQLEKEVGKYLVKDVNYGKAAKRMYNIFRYTGHYSEAAYLRELFDEPATVLYQIASLVRTLEEALTPGSDISIDLVTEQADRLILNVVEALEGPEEAEMVQALLQLRQALANRQQDAGRWHAQVEAARQKAINLVNNFFYEKLTAVPEIKAYIARFEESHGA